jgi:F-box domain
MPKRKGKQKVEATQGKQQPKKLKLGYSPGLECFKIAAEVRSRTYTSFSASSVRPCKIRNTYPKRSLCDLPTEILVNIFSHIGIVDHIILSLCSKQPSRVSQGLTDPVVLPRRGSLIYQTYKEDMELLVRLASSVPKDWKICWYRGLYLLRTDKWERHPLRRIKLWEEAPSRSIRA